MLLGFAVAVAAALLPFASAVAAPDVTTYYAGGAGPTATITADNQKVTSIDKSIKTTSYYCDKSGVYTPPHQTKVWSVYEPTWITYEVPIATAYIYPYKEAICSTCTKNVEVIVYINIDIIIYSGQIWKVIDGKTVTEIKTVTATPSYVSNYLPPSTTTPVGYAATHTVKVGGLNGTTPILRYNPEYVDAKVGDVVYFDILANNHTVTESTFDAPCVPKYGGVDSGFRPNMQNIPGTQTFPVTVTDDKPRWFYCAQPGNGKPHCQAGMVFAINAPKTGNTLEAFKKLAAAVPVSSTPSTTTSGTPSPTGGAAATYTVKVGGLDGTTPILKYNPEYVDVKVGTVVLFDILANNHTVTESTFDAPCVPKYGVDSGFRPNMQNIPGTQTFPVTVTDDKPRWFYCAQPGNGKPHCQAGMVFAINAPKTGNTLEAFKKLAAAVPISSAPSKTTSGTPSPTGGATATYTVKVGGLDGTTPILKYNPEYVDVKVGTVVLFDILANNHTVTESTFDAPCVPKYGGVDSGFRPNMQNIPGTQTFPVTVTDDKPRWFYCAQPGNGKPHCQAGMVFAINAPKTGNTLEAFKKLAAAVPVSSTPSKTTSGTPSSTGGAAATYTVKVGGLDGTTPILKYNPEYVDVKVGTVVLFDILANNHTVTESTFDAPCVPKYGGVDSGFRPNMQNIPGTQTFPVTVTDDKPRWFYCAQPGNGKPHCQAGMVFAINAPKTGNTLEAFKKLAAAVPVSGAPSRTTPRSYSPAVTHSVKVGGLLGNVTVLKYDPEYVKANIGDVIRFDILAANHTVTESTFDAPCVPKYGGVDSGFRPNKENIPGAQLFTVNVLDDKPKWFYCAQPGNGMPHCQAGMVFAINPPAYGNTLEAFKEKAAKVPVKYV